MRSLFTKVALVCAIAALSACQPKVVEVQVRLVTSACVAPSPLQDATHLRFSVRGPGIDAPLISVAQVLDARQEIPEIPAGDDRTIEVRAYQGDPASGGKVVALGSSVPFDVPDAVPEGYVPQQVTVFLRRVNSFTPPSLEVTPTTCAQMLEGRAAHSATLLQDGRVLIAGGYELGDVNGVPSRRIKGTAEIFNPGTGGFEKAADLGFTNVQQLFTPLPRAHHTAALLPSGQVFIAGGEQESGPGSYFANAASLIWDPLANKYAVVQLRQGRVAPAAVVGAGGQLLIVGGTNTQGEPVPHPEVYDPLKSPATDNPKLLTDITAPRTGMSFGAVQGGKFVALAGGSNGTQLTDEVLFFENANGTFTASSASVRLRNVRYGAGIAQFQDPNKLMIVGGYSSPTEPSSGLNTAEIIATGDQFNVAEGGVLTEGRGDVCLAPLPDGRVIAIGGRTTMGPTAQSVKAVELITPAAAGGPPSALAMPELPAGRYHHTCTTLRDGTVLVLGGVEQRNGTQKVLQDAYIFTPAPLD